MWRSEEHKKMFRRFLEQFTGQVRLDINPTKSKRSEQQNRYYWLYLGMVSEATGHTTQELHDWARSKFLTEGIVQIFGDQVRQRASTTSLSVGDFIHYLMQIEQATGIPLPNTEDYFGVSYHQQPTIKNV
jgi:hypothetical protein